MKIRGSWAVLAGVAAVLVACGGGDPGVPVFDYVARQQGQTPQLVGSDTVPVVRYTVEGLSASAEITYFDENDVQRTVAVLLPWTVTFVGTPKRFLWVWAQADAAATNISATISINDRVKMTDAAAGPFGVASGGITCC